MAADITAEHVERPLTGIVLRILSGLFFAGMSLCVKLVSDDVPLGEIVFFRSFFALIPLVIFLSLRSEFPRGLGTRRPLKHFLRSALGAAAMFTSFASIARLPLAEVTLLGYLSPIFIVAAGVVLLSERLTLLRCVSIVVGLAGVATLVGPEIGSIGWGADRFLGYGLGLATGVLTAFALITVRSLSKTENPGAIAFYFIITSMICGIVTVPFGWNWPGDSLPFLILAGIFGGLAHIATTLAFRHAEASLLAPFDYLAIIWPVLFDLVLFRISVSSAFLFALPLILLGGAIAAMDRKTR